MIWKHFPVFDYAMKNKLENNFLIFFKFIKKNEN